MIATKRAAPMMDQSTGNGCPLIVTINGSGSLSARATQGPRRAPMKPRAIETISPPRTLPAMAFPIAPQTAAITMRSRSAGSDIVMAGSFHVRIKERERKLLSGGLLKAPLRRVEGRLSRGIGPRYFLIVLATL